MTGPTPVLPGDLDAGLRRLRLGAMRRVAPDLLVNAKTQRWAPEEFLRELVETEIASRDASNTRARLKAAAFPVVKTLDEFNVDGVIGQAGDVRLPGQPRVDRGPRERVSRRPGRHRQKATSSSPSATKPSTPATGSATSPPRNSSRPSTAGWPTTPSAVSSKTSSKPTSS